MLFRLRLGQNTLGYSRNFTAIRPVEPPGSQGRIRRQLFFERVSRFETRLEDHEIRLKRRRIFPRQDRRLGSQPILDRVEPRSIAIRSLLTFRLHLTPRAAHGTTLSLMKEVSRRCSRRNKHHLLLWRVFPNKQIFSRMSRRSPSPESSRSLRAREGSKSDDEDFKSTG
jgi:hypothetical protein